MLDEKHPANSHMGPPSPLGRVAISGEENAIFETTICRVEHNMVETQLNHCPVQSGEPHVFKGVELSPRE